MTEEPPSGARRRSLLSRLFLLSVALLALALVVGLAGGLLYRREFARSWRTPKLAVPVVVIESDDWGLDYEPPQYVPGGPALDARQEAGIRRLRKVAEAHKDAAGRKAVISAFIVVHQADTPAIAADGQFAYHAKPIDERMPRTVAALKAAAADGLFSLVYHGKDHRDAGLWALKVRRAVERARAEHRPFDPDVVKQFHPRDRRERDRIVAEYFDSRRGYLEPLDQAEIDRKVRTGLDEFERIFHKRPASTVPPRYLWGPGAESAFARFGIRYVHGVNKQGGHYRDDPHVWSRPFGVRLSRGLVGIPRNTDVEVAADGTIPRVAEVLAWADRAVASGRPIVICTHACNYASASAELSDGMADCLDDVLAALQRKYPTLRYLSAEEVGELADKGKVTIEAGGRRDERRAASGLRHAWLWLKGLYMRRPKARLFARGLGVLAILAASTGLAALLGRSIRRAQG